METPMYYLTSSSKHGMVASHGTYQQGEGATARQAAGNLLSTGDYHEVRLDYCRQPEHCLTVVYLTDDNTGFINTGYLNAEFAGMDSSNERMAHTSEYLDARDREPHAPSPAAVAAMQEITNLKKKKKRLFGRR